MRRKIATVLGARPQFIKASAVSAALSEQAVFQEIVIHTGQHYDAMMSDVFFRDLLLPPPNYNLNIGSAPHGEQTGQMLQSTERILLAERPDVVLVYGDTNSTLAGALAAAKLNIPVAHVEAGMRSFNRKMPEEINRVVTDHLSSVLFAPAKQAREYLLQEGIAPTQIEVVGDVMLDVAVRWRQTAEASSQILKTLGVCEKQFVLATIHRAQTTDEPVVLEKVFQALTDLGEELAVVVPLHPRTRAALMQIPTKKNIGTRLLLIEPVGFLDMIALERAAALIITDSGGVQKEAFFHHTRCVTLRSETEWGELVNLGVNTIVDPSKTSELGRSLKVALHSAEPDWLGLPPIYGSGDAANFITKRLRQDFDNVR